MDIISYVFGIVAFVFAFDAQNKIRKLEKRVTELEKGK